jgi:hypothetical protein
MYKISKSTLQREMPVAVEHIANCHISLHILTSVHELHTKTNTDTWHGSQMRNLDGGGLALEERTTRPSSIKFN